MKNIFSIYDAGIEEIAIGKFDGVHLAHQELLKRLGSNSGVFIIFQNNEKFLSDLKLREQLLQKKVFLISLDSIKNWSGEKFVEFLKQAFINLKKIIIGYDFCFGKCRECQASDLKKLFFGAVEIVEEFKINGISVHTHNIKEALKNAQIRQANMLLGREYQIKGKVIKGQGIGKKFLYPTINLENLGYFLPKNGVYATLFSKDKIPSATFVGIRSTDSNFSMEVHLLREFHEMRDGDICDLFFVDFIRENQKFENLHLLKEQIALDIKQIQEILIQKSKK